MPSALPAIALAGQCAPAALAAIVTVIFERLHLVGLSTPLPQALDLEVQHAIEHGPSVSLGYAVKHFVAGACDHCFQVVTTGKRYELLNAVQELASNHPRVAHVRWIAGRRPGKRMHYILKNAGDHTPERPPMHHITRERGVPDFKTLRELRGRSMLQLPALIGRHQERLPVVLRQLKQVVAVPPHCLSHVATLQHRVELVQDLARIAPV